jgi:type IV pilus assembly protein PilQ
MKLVRLTFAIVLVIFLGGLAYPIVQETAEPTVNIDIKEGKIREILQFFAQVMEVNLVLSPDVQGELTVVLKDVPLSRAFSAVLRAGGLHAELSSGILYVAPISRFIENERREKEIREARKLSSPMVTVVIPISYADGTDIALIVSRFLSPRGKITVDIRTNRLIITDIPEKVAGIKKLIE